MRDTRQRSASNDARGDNAVAVADSYSDYLKLPELLALQCPLGRPAVHDELLFIIVHQTHELWFKQILCELTLLISDVDARSLDTACRTVDRMTRIANLLSGHMRVLETMPANEFERFRSALGTASGIESQQFHRLEQLAGLSSESLSARPLEAKPSRNVREAFWRAISPAPHAARVPAAAAGDDEALGSFLATRLAAPELALERRLAEALLLFDQTMVSWRREHSELAHRIIGSAAGTGGSSGAAYLRARMDRRFFPELWRWREVQPDSVPPR